MGIYRKACEDEHTHYIEQVLETLEKKQIHGKRKCMRERRNAYRDHHDGGENTTLHRRAR